jgi:dTMP kinase
MRKGLFITFEGPDGSGKTTVSTAVVAQLQKEGYQVMYTREPGGSHIAEEIRQVILDPANTAMDDRTEALLYAASRRQHLVEVVLPALARGMTVISDRFVDSSLAYQGCGRGIGMEEVMAINRFAVEGHMPDHTIFLNVPSEVGLARIASRQYLDRLDQESQAFHERVYEGYQKVIAMYRDRMTVIDASKEVDQVIADACREVKAWLDA